MKLDGVDLHVRDTGQVDRPTLLFAHGILMDGSVWDRQVEAFGDSHRCVCPDLRGYGASRADDPEITFERHADDLTALIERLELKDVTYVGWSMGGAIAMVLAARPTPPIERLVLVDTTPQLLASEDFPHALPGEAAQQLGGLLASDYPAGCAAFCSMIAPEDDAVAARLTAIASACPPPVAMAAFMSSGARHQIEELSRITVPTTIVHGREDAVCLPAAAEFMAERIASADGVRWIEGAGHASFMTRPTEFDDALREALSRR